MHTRIFILLIVVSLSLSGCFHSIVWFDSEPAPASGSVPRFDLREPPCFVSLGLAPELRSQYSRQYWTQKIAAVRKEVELALTKSGIDVRADTPEFRKACAGLATIRMPEADATAGGGYHLVSALSLGLIPQFGMVEAIEVAFVWNHQSAPVAQVYRVSTHTFNWLPTYLVLFWVNFWTDRRDEQVAGVTWDFLGRVTKANPTLARKG